MNRRDGIVYGVAALLIAVVLAVAGFAIVTASPQQEPSDAIKQYTEEMYGD